MKEVVMQPTRLPAETDSAMAKRLSIPLGTLRGILYFGARPQPKTLAKINACNSHHDLQPITTAQAAKMLGVSQAQIRIMAAHGTITHIRIPGRKRDLIRIPAGEIERLLSETTITQKTPTSKEENT
jgi:excisionase family DNA binding protein